MQIVSRKWVALAILGAALAMAWLASAPTADAASPKYHVTNYELGTALELSPSGLVVEAPSKQSSLRQQWIKKSQGGGTALYANAAVPTLCLAAPTGATSTSFDSPVIRSCTATLDKRLHWTLHTGVPFNAGVRWHNVQTGQMVMPELCIVGPCSGRPVLAPGNLADSFGTFGEWRFKFLSEV
jgi:hypothetical protein